MLRKDPINTPIAVTRLVILSWRCWGRCRRWSQQTHLALAKEKLPIVQRDQPLPKSAGLMVFHLKSHVFGGRAMRSVGAPR